MKRIQLIICLILMIPLGAFSQSYITLSGVVSDAYSGKLLDGIDVVVKDKSTGTISDYKGNYILYLNPGKYEISYSASGYQIEELKVDLNNDFVQFIELQPSKKNFQYKGFKKIQLLKKRKNQEMLSDNVQ